MWKVEENIKGKKKHPLKIKLQRKNRVKIQHSLLEYDVI